VAASRCRLLLSCYSCS